MEVANADVDIVDVVDAVDVADVIELPVRSRHQLVDLRHFEQAPGSCFILLGLTARK